MSAAVTGRQGTYGDDSEVVAQLEIAPALEAVGVGDQVGEGGVVEAGGDGSSAVVVEDVGELGGAVLGEGGGEEVADGVEEGHGLVTCGGPCAQRIVVSLPVGILSFVRVFFFFAVHSLFTKPTLPTLYTHLFISLLFPFFVVMDDPQTHYPFDIDMMKVLSV